MCKGVSVFVKNVVCEREEECVGEWACPGVWEFKMADSKRKSRHTRTGEVDMVAVSGCHCAFELVGPSNLPNSQQPMWPRSRFTRIQHCYTPSHLINSRVMRVYECMSVCVWLVKGEGKMRTMGSRPTEGGLGIGGSQIAVLSTVKAWYS